MLFLAAVEGVLVDVVDGIGLSDLVFSMIQCGKVDIVQISIILILERNIIVLESEHALLEL